MLPRLLALAATGWAALAAGFTVVTLVACARLWRRVAGRPPPARWPPLWVLRPCAGDEPHLEENLASSLASYPGERRALLLVPSEEDGARPAAERVVARFSDRAAILYTHPGDAPNRKSAQLAVGLRAAAAAPSPPELIVQADSDTTIAAGALADLVTALGDDPKVAAAFAVPVELSARTVGDTAASGLLTASHQAFFALAALSQLTGGVQAMAGALAIHRRAPLEELGGFASLENLLGEDFEIGRRLHAAGLEVAVAALPAPSPGAGRGVAEVLARTARWATVVKRQRGLLLATYPLLLAPTPLLLLASAALAPWSRLPLAAAGLLLALRVALAIALRRIHRAPVGALRALGLSLSAELLMLAASARALGSSRVVWRGRRLRVLRGGVVAPEPAPEKVLP